MGACGFGEGVPAAFRRRLELDVGARLSASVEAYVSANGLDDRAAAALRSAAPAVQRLVICAGPVVGMLNPSAACVARLRSSKSILEESGQLGFGSGMKRKHWYAAGDQEPAGEASPEAYDETYMQWTGEAAPMPAQHPVGRRGVVRRRLSDDLLFGEVVEWRGRFGWLRPVEDIDHEKANMHQGRIFVHEADLLLGGPPQPGQPVEFYLYEDRSGLGAEECVVGQVGAESEDEDETEKAAEEEDDSPGADDGSEDASW